ncbi:MAG: hypothetical protein D6742_00810 [Cyanobacteria bacterium J069]|nr:MAG: hypothetical protein D6742_00810 [Cyanobacteria bacterium J069]
MSESDFNKLLKTVDRLFEELDSSGAPYLLVGGIAMLTYVEGRNTEDIDLIMRRPDLLDQRVEILFEPITGDCKLICC